jgi:hypothetical protein
VSIKTVTIDAINSGAAASTAGERSIAQAQLDALECDQDQEPHQPSAKFSDAAMAMLRMFGKPHLIGVTTEEWSQYAQHHGVTEAMCEEYWIWHCPDAEYLELLGESRRWHRERVRDRATTEDVRAHAVDQIKKLEASMGTKYTDPWAVPDPGFEGYRGPQPDGGYAPVSNETHDFRSWLRSDEVQETLGQHPLARQTVETVTVHGRTAQLTQQAKDEWRLMIWLGRDWFQIIEGTSREGVLRMAGAEQ